MPKMYVVTILTPDKEIPTILSVLKGSATLVSIKEQDVPAPVAGETRKISRSYVNGKHNKGISGADLVLQVLASEQRIFSAEEISGVFVKNGFAGNSASPAISRLVKDNKVRMVTHGKYCLPGLTLKLGEAR